MGAYYDWLNRLLLSRNPATELEERLVAQLFYLRPPRPYPFPRSVWGDTAGRDWLSTALTYNERG